MDSVRHPAVAGMFYPGNANKLKEELKLLFDIASKEEKYDNVFGLVAPHAGYVYSGRTAAYGYHAVSGKKYKSAVVISPSHREYFPGVSVYDGNAYETPLGLVKVDQELRKLFTSDTKAIFEGMSGHRNEHALEVHLPFLQYLYEDITILPVVLGDQSKPLIEELAEKLTKVPDDTLIVASSDLSHFYSKEEADKLDSRVAKRIEDFQPDELQTDFEKQNSFACGGGGIVALMKAAEKVGKKNSKVLHRSDSGDTSGDNQEVVGYLSAIVY